MHTVNPQFITDQKGNKVSVILPIEEYNTLIEALEELDDIRLYDESKNDKKPAISKTKAMQLIEAGRRKLV